jgi:hypothetical protein
MRKNNNATRRAALRFDFFLGGGGDTTVSVGGGERGAELFSSVSVILASSGDCCSGIIGSTAGEILGKLDDAGISLPAVTLVSMTGALADVCGSEAVLLVGAGGDVSIRDDKSGTTVVVSWSSFFWAVSRRSMINNIDGKNPSITNVKEYHNNVNSVSLIIVILQCLQG